jgi:Pin2-interacting protein X1
MAQTSGERTAAAVNAALASAALAARTTTANLAGSKLRKQMSITLQEQASAPTSEFAVKQLQKMGWTEGAGLGKKGTGITTHIKVKKRAEQAGIGTETAAAEKQASTEQWWKDSVGDTLARLGSKKGKDKKRRRKDYTDEELFEATGGSRFGMRAGITKNLAKWRRTEGEMDETVAKVSVDEEVENKEATKDDARLDEPTEKKKKKKSKSDKKPKEDVEAELSKKAKKAKKKDKKEKQKKSKDAVNA